MEELVLENKSYRGMLVKIIVESVVKDYMFESYDKLPELIETLQEKLNQNLAFTTVVSKFRSLNDYIFGQISFFDENSEPRVLDVTVARSIEFDIK